MCRRDRYRPIGSPIGVVVRHVADGHYGLADWARTILAGGDLPDMKMEDIDKGNAEHAEAHKDCTKAEVLGLLRENGSAIVDLISGLSDEDLEKGAHLPLMGADITAKQVFKILFNGCEEHINSLKAAIA